MVTQMDYPSTTQSLFALIVMIIVLVFILVYCCWGTFACSKTQDMMQSENETRTRRNDSNSTRNNLRTTNSNSSRDSSNPRALVILPYNNMVYIGDRETRRVYHFPMSTSAREDKPPSYGDLFSVLPPIYDSQEMLNSEESNPDMPPTYEECLNLFKSASSAEGMDKFIVPSVDDLVEICTSLSRSNSRTHVGVSSTPSISASSEPALSNISNDELSSTDLPLSRTKSNLYRCNFLTTRFHPSRGDVESQFNCSPPMSNAPKLSRTFANLSLTIGARGSSGSVVPSCTTSSTRLETVDEFSTLPSASQQSSSGHLSCLEESNCENLSQMEVSSGDVSSLPLSSEGRQSETSIVISPEMTEKYQDQSK